MVFFAGSQSRAAAGEQVDEQHNDGDNQQQMDQTPCHVKAESQKPHDEQNYKNGPEHKRLPEPSLQTGVSFYHTVLAVTDTE
jgi:hypothetical protein